MHTYKHAPNEVQEKVKALRKKAFPQLDKARVRVDVLFVASDEDDGSPITQWGVPQAAKTRIIGQRDRVDRGDAEILIDHREFETLTVKQQEALLFRQLHVLKLKTDKDGKQILDGNNRPKLELRKPDRVFAWYDAAAQAYGENSLEVTQARTLIESATGQMYFPGFELTAKASVSNAGNKSNVVAMPQQEAGKAAAAK